MEKNRERYQLRNDVDDQNTAELQSAFQQRENVEAALDQVIANVVADGAKHMKGHQ